MAMRTEKDNANKLIEESLAHFRLPKFEQEFASRGHFKEEEEGESSESFVHSNLFA